MEGCFELLRSLGFCAGTARLGRCCSSLGSLPPGAQGKGTKANRAFALIANRTSADAVHSWIFWTNVVLAASAVPLCLWDQGSWKAWAVPEGHRTVLFAANPWVLVHLGFASGGQFPWECLLMALCPCSSYTHVALYLESTNNWIICFSVLLGQKCFPK